MKKALLIILFITINAYAQDNYELKFYERVMPLIFNTPIHVYADIETRLILKGSKKFIFERNCTDANLTIGTIKNNKCKNKPLFATDYETYKLSTNAFGAFYWRKGRPQLKFKKDKIKEFNLHLDKTLQKYIK